MEAKPTITQYSEDLAKIAYEGKMREHSKVSVLEHCQKTKDYVFSYIIANKHSPVTSEAYDLVCHFDFGVATFYIIANLVSIGMEIETVARQNGFSTDWYLKKIQEKYPDSNDNFFFLIKSALIALTQSGNETYMSHIYRCKKDPLARLVKICSLTQGINEIEGTTDDKPLLMKYRNARACLMLKGDEGY